MEKRDLISIYCIIQLVSFNYGTFVCSKLFVDKVASTPSLSKLAAVGLGHFYPTIENIFVHYTDKKKI